MTTPNVGYGGLHALSAAVQMKPLLTLTFYSYGILLRKPTEHGGETEYPVSPSQLTAAISTNLQFTTGLLPENTIYVSLVGAKRIIVGYRVPQRTALFIDGTSTPIRVPLPGLLMVRVTTGEDNPGYTVHAVNKRPDTLDTRLFAAPLPNISAQSVCWGTVPKVSTAALASSDLTEDWSALLGSQFTNHTVHDKSKSHPADIRAKLLELERRKARRYPLRDLIRLPITLGELIQKLERTS